MTHITAEQIESAVKLRGIIAWAIRNCSICSWPIGYKFHQGGVFFDSNCACSDLYSQPDVRNYQDVADTINAQTNQTEVNSMLDFWKFEQQEERK